MGRHTYIYTFYTKESRINATRNAFSRVGVRIWNEIPATLKKCKKSFKESLKGKLFDILETVDSYIEVETIIDQLKLKTNHPCPSLCQYNLILLFPLHLFSIVILMIIKITYNLL